MKNTSIKYCLLSLLLAFQFASCSDNIKSSIPDYPVSLDLNLTSTYATFKNSVNEFIVYDKKINEVDCIGYGGIIVCTSGFDDSGNSLYFAFDMACPFEVKNNIRVYPDTTGLSRVVCEKCGSVFDVSYGNGSPISGPAKETLKRYRTNFVGDVLYITR